MMKMKKSLVVYFSHNKENYVKGKIVYLDEGNTKVVASMGHIRDLPKSKLGVDIENNF